MSPTLTRDSSDAWPPSPLSLRLQMRKHVKHIGAVCMSTHVKKTLTLIPPDSGVKDSKLLSWLNPVNLQVSVNFHVLWLNVD